MQGLNMLISQLGASDTTIHTIMYLCRQGIFAYDIEKKVKANVGVFQNLGVENWLLKKNQITRRLKVASVMKTKNLNRQENRYLLSSNIILHNLHAHRHYRQFHLYSHRHPPACALGTTFPFPTGDSCLGDISGTKQTSFKKKELSKQSPRIISPPLHLRRLNWTDIWKKRTKKW